MTLFPSSGLFAAFVVASVLLALTPGPDMALYLARTFGGGLRYRVSSRQDIRGYVAWQDRTQGRTQNSFGVTYGIRF